MAVNWERIKEDAKSIKRYMIVECGSYGIELADRLLKTINEEMKKDGVTNGKRN